MTNPQPDVARGGAPLSTRARGIFHTGGTGIFRRKPIPLQQPDEEQQLKRSLGLWSLTAIGDPAGGKEIYLRVIGYLQSLPASTTPHK